MNALFFTTIATQCNNGIRVFADNHTRDVIGYPLPGRAYYGTVSAKF